MNCEFLAITVQASLTRLHMIFHLVTSTFLRMLSQFQLKQSQTMIVNCFWTFWKVCRGRAYFLSWTGLSSTASWRRRACCRRRVAPCRDCLRELRVAVRARDRDCGCAPLVATLAVNESASGICGSENENWSEKTTLNKKKQHAPFVHECVW